MKFGLLASVLVSFLVGSFSQTVSPAEAKIVEAARQKYYRLADLGLVSFRCNIDFDLNTLPPQVMPPADSELRQQLEKVRIVVQVDTGKPQVNVNATDDLRANRAAALSLNILQSLASGFWMTWPSKGWNGPLPPFAKWVDSVTPAPGGYVIRSKSTEGLDSITLSKDLNVTRILSVGGRVDESPTYAATPDGLVYSGLSAVSTDETGSKTMVHYEITSAHVDGFRLPQAVRMRVDDNIDVRFAMTSCSTKMATAVISVNPL